MAPSKGSFWQSLPMETKAGLWWRDASSWGWQEPELSPNRRRECVQVTEVRNLDW